MSEIKDPNEPGDCCPDCKVGIEQDRAEMLRSASTVTPKPKMSELSVNFSAKGKAGDVIVVEAKSERHIFRTEKIIGGDSIDRGHGTKMRVLSFGEDRQLTPHGVANERKPTATAYDNNKLGCGIRWPTIHPGETITIEVEFLVDCIWMAACIGRGIEVES